MRIGQRSSPFSWPLFAQLRPRQRVVIGHSSTHPSLIALYTDSAGLCAVRQAPIRKRKSSCRVCVWLVFTFYFLLLPLYVLRVFIFQSLSKWFAHTSGSLSLSLLSSLFSFPGFRSHRQRDAQRTSAVPTGPLTGAFVFDVRPSSPPPTTTTSTEESREVHTAAAFFVFSCAYRLSLSLSLSSLPLSRHAARTCRHCGAFTAEEAYRESE